MSNNIENQESSNSISHNITSITNNQSLKSLKLSDSIINDSNFDNNPKNINNSNTLIEKNKISVKAEKSISEKIEEKLNNINKNNPNLISNNNLKNDFIDLNEIENKLNMSINKNKEINNLSKNDLSSELKRKISNKLKVL